MLRTDKQAIIEETVRLLDGCEALYVGDYRGLTVAELTKLRASLRDRGATLRVLKNTLTSIAAEQAGQQSLKELLSGPTAVAFCGEDLVGPAKALSDYARANPAFVVRGGVLQGNVLDADGVRRLAALPSREVLVAQVVGTMAAPLTGLVTVLQGTISGFVRALDQVAQQRATGGAA
ncbi:MAG TPA: 50S ribosomal protein L10 [Thermoleophilia bacterium]|nr:50S ribosomal protein L10 [Thermoleophilia bacterium]